MAKKYFSIVAKKKHKVVPVTTIVKIDKASADTVEKIAEAVVETPIEETKVEVETPMEETEVPKTSSRRGRKPAAQTENVEELSSESSGDDK